MYAKKLFLFFLAAQLLEIGGIRSKEDILLENNLIKGLERFRLKKNEENSVIKFPVGDPLKHLTLNISVGGSLGNLYFHVNKMTFYDPPTFKLQTVDVDAENLLLEVKFQTLTMQAFGNYDLSGKILGIFPVKGGGKISVNFTSIEISAIMKLGIVNGKLQVDDLKLAITKTDVKVHMDHSFRERKMFSLVKKLFPEFEENIFEYILEGVLKNVRHVLKDNINVLLKNSKTVAIINEFLLGL